MDGDKDDECTCSSKLEEGVSSPTLCLGETNLTSISHVMTQPSQIGIENRELEESRPILDEREDESQPTTSHPRTFVAQCQSTSTPSPPFQTVSVQLHGSISAATDSPPSTSKEESAKDPSGIAVGVPPPKHLNIFRAISSEPEDEALKSEVRSGKSQLEDEFAMLMMKLRQELEHGAKFEDVQGYLSSKANNQRDNIIDPKECMEQLREIDSYVKLFLLFDQHRVWDFQNFRFLDLLLKHFLPGNESLKLEVGEYAKRVVEFQASTKLRDFLSVWSGQGVTDVLKDGHEILQTTVIGDLSSFTLADVAKKQAYLAREFLLQEFVFKVLHAGSGSVILYWLVSKRVAEHIKETFEKVKPDLREGGILELFVGDCLIYKALDISMYEELYQWSLDSPKEFWGYMANMMLVWEEPFNIEKVLDGCSEEEGKIQWFNGKINASVNCLDRHVKAHPDRVAIVWEKDDNTEEQERVTYEQLLENTCRIANVLKDHNVKQGERVIIYMPAMPLAVASMLACARIGAVHSVVFAALKSDELKTRIKNAEARVILTADEFVRGGETRPLKIHVDDALESILEERKLAKEIRIAKNRATGDQQPLVDNFKDDHEFVVLIAKRTGKQIPIIQINGAREKLLEVEMERQDKWCDPVPMDSESPLFVIYTSGTTDQPIGIEHSTAGYLLHVALSHKYVFDHQPDDIFGCVAVLGWITGHSYVVYGPLCNGATTVLFESTATHPNHGRYWEMIDRLGITQFYTTPSSIRCLMKDPDNHIDKFEGKLKSLRLIASVGEPLNKSARDWYLEKVGQKRCPLIDTWWQTETGGICIVMDHQLPDKYNAKFPPRPFFGVKPLIIDPNSEQLKEKKNSHSEDPGYLCLETVLPGMGRHVIVKKQKQVAGEKVVVKGMKEIYFSRGIFFTYDWAHTTGSGGYRVLGRMDDAIRVKGVWLDIPEIESAMNLCDSHIEDTSIVGLQSLADVCGIDFSHDYGGTCAFVELRCNQEDLKKFQDDLIRNLKLSVEKVDQKYPAEAVPRMFIIIGQQLLTHSGKIARTYLRKIISLTRDISNVCSLKKLPGADNNSDLDEFQNINLLIIYKGSNWLPQS